MLATASMLAALNTERNAMPRSLHELVSRMLSALSINDFPTYTPCIVVRDAFSHAEQTIK